MRSMRGTTGALTASAVLSVVLLVSLGGAVTSSEPVVGNGTAGEDDIGAQTSVGTTTSAFTWSSTVTGDFALRMVLDFPALELCTFHIKSAGRFTDRPVQQYTAHDEPGGGWTVLAKDHLFGTHVSGISIRSNDVPYTHWAAYAYHEFSAYGKESWLFAGFSLQGWNNPVTNGNSVLLDLSCTGPFTITQIEGGKSLLGFVPKSIVGGAGAHAPLVDVNVADFVIRQFAEPHVAFRFRSDPFFGTGLLTLSGPGTSARWTITGDAEAFHDGAAGRYQASLTRVAVDGKAVGLLAGLQDVSSFDEAAGL